MANTPQARKRIRRNARRNEINGNRVSRIRTFVKKVEAALAAGDKGAVGQAANLDAGDTVLEALPEFVAEPVHGAEDVVLARPPALLQAPDVGGNRHHTAAPQRDRYGHMAIHPYPAHLVGACDPAALLAAFNADVDGEGAGLAEVLQVLAGQAQAPGHQRRVEAGRAERGEQKLHPA